MNKNKKIGGWKTAVISIGTSSAVVLFLGAIFAFGAGEPLLSTGMNSSGQFGVGTTSPGSNLSVLGNANLGSLVVEGVLKASTIIATSSISTPGDVVVSDATKGIRLKDTTGGGCHRISVNSAGVLSTTNVDCGTGAAIAIADDFNSYSNGDLPSNNGGMGWSGSWTSVTNGSDADVQGATVSEGSKAVIFNPNGSGVEVSRDFASVSADGSVLSVYVRKAETSHGFDVLAKSGSTMVGQIIFAGDGNIKINNGGSSDTIQGYSANTWYHLEVYFDFTNHTYKARIDGGSYTADKSFVNSSGSISRILLSSGGSPTGTDYVDNITLQ